MLKNRQPYLDPSADYYEEQYQIRALCKLKHHASILGLGLELVGVA